MSEQKKPREFWIETHETCKGRKNIDGFQVWPQVYESEIVGTIKVIEYSAFQAAQERIKNLEEKLKEAESIAQANIGISIKTQKKLISLKSKHTALLEQVEKLVGRLKNSTYFQNGAKNYLEHHENCNIEDYEMPDDEACMCGLDNFSQDNHVSVCISKQTLAEYEAWKKENLK